MAITFTATLNDGSTSVAAAGWSDATGFGHANPKLLIAGATQTISSDLDQSGAANACDLLHIVGAHPRIVGSANAPLKVKFDATYTTDPNFVWNCDDGVLYIEAATNVVKEAIIAGKGTVYLVDGEWERVVVAGGVNVIIPAACDVSVELIVQGGHVWAEEAADTIPTIRVLGGSAQIERRVETTAHLAAGTLRLFNDSGSALGTLNIHGGTFIPEAGGVGTVNRMGGNIILTAARRAVALGSTAIENYGPTPFPKSQGLVTVGGGTTKDYMAYALSSGAPGLP